VPALDPGLSSALTPYLLMFGAFTYPLLKVAHVKRIVTRVYGYIYVLTALALAFNTYIGCMNNQVYVYFMAGFPPPIGITYVVDNLNAFLALIVTILFATLYPLMKDYVNDNEYFYAMLLALEAGFTGILYTGDIFNMFVMSELTLIAAYSLISSYERPGSFKGALKYALIAGVSGMLFFLSIILYYNVLGTLNIGHGGAIVDSLAPSIGRSPEPYTAVLAVLVFMLWSLLVETALVPLHFWIPDAYSNAPPPVAGLLAGIAEGVGFYMIIRIYYVLLKGFTPSIALLIGILGILSILVGGFSMIFSNNALKIVSYSVILDAGYIAIALSLGATGVYIALSYIIAHAVVKPLLFITMGYATHHRGTTLLDNLNGVFRSNPVLQLGFLTGVAAVVGIPPTILFQAKLQLYMEALQAFGSLNIYVWAALATMVLGSALALAGFTRLLYPVLFMTGEPVPRPRGYTGVLIIVLTVTVLLLGIVYLLIYNQLIVPAGSSVITHRIDYVKTVLENLGWLKK
jgi:multicomponent Na+:H+ antiporter subunit D